MAPGPMSFVEAAISVGSGSVLYSIDSGNSGVRTDGPARKPQPEWPGRALGGLSPWAVQISLLMYSRALKA